MLSSHLLVSNGTYVYAISWGCAIIYYQQFMFVVLNMLSVINVFYHTDESCYI